MRQGERACPPEDCGGPYGYPYLSKNCKTPSTKNMRKPWNGLATTSILKVSTWNNERRPYRLRRWLGKRRGKNLQSAFSKGDLVRVKPGIVHDRYPDIPLGGWVGKIKRIGWLTPIAYAVHWTKPTLEQAHAIYFKRCQRDDLEPHRCWLEEDQLEAATDETPAAMEQPTNIITRPLSMDEPR